MSETGLVLYVYMASDEDGGDESCLTVRHQPLFCNVV
jgi:hypothetical protein